MMTRPFFGVLGDAWRCPRTGERIVVALKLWMRKHEDGYEKGLLELYDQRNIRGFPLLIPVRAGLAYSSSNDGVEHGDIGVEVHVLVSLAMVRWFTAVKQGLGRDAAAY